MPEIPEARPASTVVLLRDSGHGLETLLLRRGDRWHYLYSGNPAFPHMAGGQGAGSDVA